MPQGRSTRIVKVDARHPAREALEEAAAVLRRGGLVAFPTETVYGLGANALSADAVAKIFKAKGRPSDNPLIVHVADTASARALAKEWPDLAERAARAFWPGPLTLVVPAAPAIPAIVTAGLDTVALRVPAHPVALALLRIAALPVAAPSANRSGRPSPTRAEHVAADLAGSIDLIIDGGPTDIGVESSVLDVTLQPPVLLRPGGVTVEDLESVLGTVVVGDGSVSEEAPRSPGMKYRHYAPECPAIVVEGEIPERWHRLVAVAAEQCQLGKKVGVIATDEAAAHLAECRQVSAPWPGNLFVRSVGPVARPASYAATLFAHLRDLEAAGCDVIVMEGADPEGIGLAVRNRVRKAAGNRVVLARKGVDSTSP